MGNFPPFFIEEGERGIFIEIIDEIFKQLPQYKVEYIFMSNHRILHEINYGQSIDVACNIFPSSKLKAHLSEPIFRYIDVAISKKSAHLTVATTADLKGKHIAAYQGATEMLGDDFQQMAYYSKQKNLTSDEFNIHYLWPSLYSHMAFKDPQLKNVVDDVIKALKLNGTIEKIYAKYNI